MTRFQVVVLFAVLAASALSPTAQANAQPPHGPAAEYFGQVPLLPLPEGDHPDIDALMGEYWAAYWRAPGKLGFGAADIRAGRFDLDNDGEAELAVLLNADTWRHEKGQPLVIARWKENRGWVPVGWSWADTDSVFATREIRDDWRTIDTGVQLLRWTGRVYEVVEK